MLTLPLCIDFPDRLDSNHFCAKFSDNCLSKIHDQFVIKKDLSSIQPFMSLIILIFATFYNGLAKIDLRMDACIISSYRWNLLAVFYY
jgi:hypothetical protein